MNMTAGKTTPGCFRPAHVTHRPGDHVVWTGEEAKRPAVVQSVNAAERIASVLLTDTRTIESLSVLELDPHGTSDLAAIVPHSTSEGLGVRRGDFVFIHRPGTTNGFEKPCVPRIGELEAWVREGPALDGQLTGWRKEMADIGTSIAARRVSEEVQECQIKLPTLGCGDFLWLGEVTNVKRPFILLPHCR